MKLTFTTLAIATALTACGPICDPACAEGMMCIQVDGKAICSACEVDEDCGEGRECKPYMCAIGPCPRVCDSP